MKELITDKFIIEYEDELKDFIDKSLEIAKERLPLIEDTLDCKNIEIGKLKASFFTSRDNFVNYIKSISGGRIPPKEAVGCFYNCGIQCLIDTSNKEMYERNLYTLTHELVHIYIYKLIYQKFNINRIKWLDESCAEYLSGYMETLSKQEIKEFFNMNKIKNCQIGTGHMFMIIGKYIFENNLAKPYINILKENPDEIQEIGKDIFLKALKYIDSLKLEVK